MSSPIQTSTVTIIGGGVVGAALLFTLAHRGVDTLLLEGGSDLGYAASGTNSGVQHTGFDSTPGELETELILRSARLRPAVIDALDVPILRTGAELIPHRDEDHETIRALAENAAANGVEVSIRESDGALLVPGEWVSDPVAYTLSLAASGVAAGGRVEVDAQVAAIDASDAELVVRLADGRSIHSEVVINAAGLHADDVARLVGDDSFSIFPRKGEFFVFELPHGATLDTILLPAPTKRTKGVLVFPTLDGKVVAGPTAVDLEDKNDWSVRPEAREEILEKAVQQFPALKGLEPVFSYAGLRPAGRNSNYIIGSSPAEKRLINVAAIRSTGLSASLGIADYVAELLPGLGIELGEQRPVEKVPAGERTESWWKRTALLHSTGAD